MKKLIVALMVMAMTATAMVGCGSNNTDSKNDSNASTQADANADTDEGSSNAGGTINVISREDGSGTRGAFIELFGIEEKDADGNKVDNTTEEATIANSTEIVLSNVASDPSAIGYVSLGSLNDKVKALKIDGAEATVDNIKSGTYKISRPFNIATNGTPSDAAQDFINYILSSEGQKVVEDAGYIASVDNAEAYANSGAKGKVVIAGSSSVTPVMEKLKEAYAKVNSDVEIEINQSDSTTGLQAAMDGTADIGMASRELKDSENSLTPTVIAIDGIAVIVNNDNSVDDMTADQIKAIFTGETTTW
ncbi:substrate-binding domain-containing protein [Roseburia sp. MSJ-14]|uniref:substrate-binding domain-containing protein n=1 Tax=Roseburia sp. MSJ-14 TaxID=2841514 RepID=UPI001C10548B|nr:substrate-binding domain-containing protein [Roseburia sp. MSJ-14]MBU5474734.1 substrate-binding domain-containing protein [Roseburia sp. MSJ-14]